MAKLELELQVPVYDPAALDAVVAQKGWAERNWPYWLEDWPASLRLIEVLEKEARAGISGPVLDLGCGAGLLTRYFASRFTQTFACDINEEACRLTRFNLPDSSLAKGNAAVVCADLNHIPFRIRFGLVAVGELLYDHALAGQVLAFLGLALADQGMALLADAGRFTADDLPNRALQAGFEIHRLEKSSAERHRVFALTRPGRELHFPLSEAWTRCR